jgi:hypothetical protein
MHDLPIIDVTLIILVVACSLSSFVKGCNVHLQFKLLCCRVQQPNGHLSPTPVALFRMRLRPPPLNGGKEEEKIVCSSSMFESLAMCSSSPASQAEPQGAKTERMVMQRKL